MADNAKKAAKTPKPWIIIRGKKYELRFDVWALEQIEEEFGGVSNMMESLNGQGGAMLSKAMVTVFRILANSARDYAGLEPNVTGDEVRHEPVGKLTEAVAAAIAAGRRSETTGGNEADDEIYDAYEDEYDEKNV